MRTLWKYWICFAYLCLSLSKGHGTTLPTATTTTTTTTSVVMTLQSITNTPTTSSTMTIFQTSNSPLEIKTKTNVTLPTTMRISSSTVYTVSSPANTTHSAETADNVGVIFYISVPAAFASGVLLVVIVIILLRRRKRKKKKKNAELYGVYNGIEVTFDKRTSVSGIINRSYSGHILEIQENGPLSHTQIPESNDSVYTKIKSCDLPPGTVVTAIDEHEAPILYPPDITEDRYGYNHVKKATPAVDDMCYSHVNKMEAGFRIQSDTNYNRTKNQTDDSGPNRTINDFETGSSTYNKICLQNEVFEKQLTDTPNRLGDKNSIYDHAKAGGPDPEFTESNFYSHLNAASEQTDFNPRHGYENVATANGSLCDVDDQCLSQGHLEGPFTNPDYLANDQYYSLIDVKGHATDIVTPRHEYVNVQKDKQQKPDKPKPAADNMDYEEAVGHTPTYYVLEP